MMRPLFFALFLLIFGNAATAQYTLNGNAQQNTCHCYTLTSDAFSQSGSIWNDNKINLTQSFDFKFDVFLGCADLYGADGIVFVLQPISTSVGSVGGGLGYSGVSPAIGVTIDTWQNGSPSTPGPDGDPPFDHIAIQLNGDINHKDSVAPFPINNIAGPVSALANSDNIEDCQWHILRIQWDATTKIFSAYVDGILRVSVVKDLVTDVFKGDPMVFWGFTGSTGGSKNLQQICTALKPVFRFLPNQKRCLGETITFYDSTIAFAPLQKSYWDFGDGSPIDSVNLNPVHVYAAAGNYTVIQKVLGAEGCIEMNTQQVIIGSIPLAAFEFNNACALDSTVNFNDKSSATFGTIDHWYWDLGDSTVSGMSSPSKIYATPGFKKVRLSVSSVEGCVSDTTDHIVQVYEKPAADFSFLNNTCAGVAMQFTGISSVTDGSISGWDWKLGSSPTAPAHTQSPFYTYLSAGQHTVLLVTKTSTGCTSNTASKTVDILPSPVAYFKNNPVCIMAPASFTDSSYSTGADLVTGWWWSMGSGTISNVQHPVATYGTAGNVQVWLVAKTGNGCISDTLKKLITVEPKPIAKFGHVIPVCENVPTLFSDSSFVAAGTIQSWYWQFDNGTVANMQQPVIALPAGNRLVKLMVKDDKGCSSDTVSSTILVHPKPLVDFVISDACVNSTVSFKGIDRSGGTITNWRWVFDNGSIVPSKDTVHFYDAKGVFPVMLSGIAATGCYTDTLVKDITIYGTGAFAGNDTIAVANQPMKLQGSGGVNYEWSPSIGLSNAFIADPVALNNKDRRYILRAFTPVGCSSYDTINIRIYDGPEIYVPTAFSPNSDGLNDVLKALPVGMMEFKYFTIFNRLGHIMFSTSVPAKGWDGIYKGKVQNEGTYIWIAAAVGFRGNIISRKGTVILLR